MEQKLMVDRRNMIYKRGANRLNRKYLNEPGRDITSRLRMRCCGKFIVWNGTGMKGLLAETNNCPLCGSELDTRTPPEVKA